ncbi:MAG TPA: zinc ribbon domain-containing protein [Gemmatimonadaceae bacterium]
MDNLDRMFRHLARTVRAKHPQYLTQPFTVAELHQTILPYRLHRRELGLETNEDYEITLTQLLSGARDYLIVDESMRDRLRSELASKNPDPTAFKQFAMMTVGLSPNALRSLDAGPDDSSTPPVAFDALPTPAVSSPPAVAPAPARSPEPPASRSAPRPTSPQVSTPTRVSPSRSPIGSRAVVASAGERCRYCNELLPAGRTITFCPHCGQNLTVVNCEACGTELEVGWKFCPVCGRPAGSTA